MVTATVHKQSRMRTDIPSVFVDALRSFRCQHNYVRTERSNVLQLDDLGYPLRLYMMRCTKCGESKQRWIDVSIAEMDELDSGKSVLLRWEPER